MIMEGFKSSLDTTASGTECIALFFSSWVLDERWKFYIACIGVFLACICVQYIAKFRIILRQSRSQPSSGPINSLLKIPLLRSATAMVASSGNADDSKLILYYILSLFAYAVQVILSYFIMLVTMTYSIELFCMVCAGLICGQALFNLDLPPSHSTEACCAEIPDDDSDHIADLRYINEQQGDYKPIGTIEGNNLLTVKGLDQVVKRSISPLHRDNSAYGNNRDGSAYGEAVNDPEAQATTMQQSLRCDSQYGGV